MNLPAEKAFAKLVALGYSWNGDEWVQGTEVEASNDNGWITWNGGKQPVSDGTRIDVMYRNGDTKINRYADHFAWFHVCGKYDIVAYRIVNQ